MRLYERQVQNTFGNAVAMAAFEYLNATAETIPQWSGASAATFLHLARAVGYSLQIHPVVNSRIPLGLNRGVGEFKVAGGVYKFRYATTLDHLIFNEYNNANDYGYSLRQPGPYRFQQRGYEAVKSVASQIVMPPVKFRFTTMGV